MRLLKAAVLLALLPITTLLPGVEKPRIEAQDPRVDVLLGRDEVLPRPVAYIAHVHSAAVRKQKKRLTIREGLESWSTQKMVVQDGPRRLVTGPACVPTLDA